MNVHKGFTCIYRSGGLNKKLLYGFEFSKYYCKRHFAMEDRPVEKSIQNKLKSSLKPVHLSIVNESYMHNVPRGSETHFKVFVVSEDFENMALINRHRLVNSILEEELKSGVHALSIIAKTPSQWDQSEVIEPSPKCLGGFGLILWLMTRKSLDRSEGSCGFLAIVGCKYV